jgi:hypothetical protein
MVKRRSKSGEAYETGRDTETEQNTEFLHVGTVSVFQKFQQMFPTDKGGQRIRKIVTMMQ